MKKNIDVKTWKRKEHFEFFSKLDMPYYSTTVMLNAAKLYQKVKQEDYSFYIAYLHAVLTAVNRTEALCLRIEAGQPVLYDKIHVSMTVLRKDHTFGATFVEYEENFKRFAQAAQEAIHVAQQRSGFLTGHPAPQADLVHFSALPWLHFTMMNEACNLGNNEAVPAIAVGKALWRGECFELPISLRVNHAVVDGWDIGQFVQTLQALMEK